MAGVEEFRRSLADPAPPAEAGLPLQALWWAGKGDWDRAHGLAMQGEGDAACDLVHAYLHRVEGDLGNAGYWYRRAGRRPADSPLEGEWEAIAAELLRRPSG